MPEDFLRKSARSSQPINKRFCVTCGSGIRSALYCYKCYGVSEAGLAERRLAQTILSYKPQADGGPCRNCVHWDRRCSLGLPEGGTLAAVDLCSARQLDSLLE